MMTPTINQLTSIVAPIKYAKGFLNILLLLQLFLLSTATIAQNSFTNNLEKTFQQYRQQNFQEKLFVHTDKEFYVAGEIVWFKLYCVNGDSHQSVNISKVAYVEIIDSEGNPVLQGKIALVDGFGNGSFHIPFTISTGNFIIRAYTAWMKNFDADYYFQQSITIVNTVRRPDWAKLEKTRSYDFQLFPEGGHLVQNIESKIAFRIVDFNGKGMAARGVIINDKSDTLAHFETARFGLGNFLFKPQPGNQYKAVLKLENGDWITKDFPTIQEAGYVLMVNEKGKDVTINISTNTAADSVYLVSHCRQKVNKILTQSLINGQAEFIMPTSELKDGINHFTLFNSQNQPICERLYFKHPVDTLVIKATSPVLVFNKREKATIHIETIGKNQIHTSAQMSVAVQPFESIANNYNNHILSYLFLTSELKGTVETPSYYFLEKGAEVDKALDNLMLVHGWARYNWKQLKPATNFNFLPEYEGPVIKAFLRDTKTGNEADQKSVYVSAQNVKSFFSYVNSNTKGNLLFPTKHLFGFNNLIFQIPNKKDSLYSINIESPFALEEPTLKFPQFSINQKNESELVKYNTSTQVQNLYYEKPLQWKPAVVDTTSFFGRPDKTYWLDDYTRFKTMEEVMREYISEVRIKRNSKDFSFSVLNTPYLSHFEENPLVLLDGIPIFNMNHIMEMDPHKIQKIDVVSRKYFYGATTFNGIVSYSSYPQNVQNNQINKSGVVVRYEGLQLKREFFSPVYEQKEQIESRLPDFRNVLLWAPHVQSDKKGSKDISFYTSDLAGEYLVVIQGITTDGLAGYTTLKIKVQ